MTKKPMHSDGEQQVDPEIKRTVLLRSEITNWARDWGLDDGDQLNAEEAYEMLEQGVEDFLNKYEASHSHLIEEVEKMKKDEKKADSNYNLIDIQGYNQACDDFISLLKRKGE